MLWNEWCPINHHGTLHLWNVSPQTLGREAKTAHVVTDNANGQDMIIPGAYIPLLEATQTMATLLLGKERSWKKKKNVQCMQNRKVHWLVYENQCIMLVVNDDANDRCRVLVYFLFGFLFLLAADVASDNEFRIQVLERLAEVCESQGSYQLATKKFTQAGSRTKVSSAPRKSSGFFFFLGKPCLEAKKKRDGITFLTFLKQAHYPKKICRSQSTNQSGEWNERLTSWCALWPADFQFFVLIFFFFFFQWEEQCSHSFNHLSTVLQSLVAPFERGGTMIFFFFGNRKCELISNFSTTVVPIWERRSVKWEFGRGKV